MAQDTKERLFEPPPAPGEDGNHESVAALFAGTYEVHERLAWNGLALVYRVRSVEADDGHEERAPGRERAVALLPIDCESRPELLRPFEAQAARLVGYTDAHAVATLAAGSRHGVPYLVLPYAEGTTLAQEIAVRGAMAAPRALGIASDVLRALSTAHARGLRHWDLTPSNVLLAPIASGAPARVLAMGLAPIVRAMSDSDMTGPTGKGSGPSATKFLAPELLHGGSSPADGRADLYAVGALIVAMLTGTRPGKANEDALPIVAVKGLSDVIRKAMAKEPADRYASADEFLAALVSAGGDDLVTVPVASKAAASAAPATARPALSFGGEMDELVTVPVVSKAPRASTQAATSLGQAATSVGQPAATSVGQAATSVGPAGRDGHRKKTSSLALMAGASAVIVLGGVVYWAATQPTTTATEPPETAPPPTSDVAPPPTSDVAPAPTSDVAPTPATDVAPTPATDMAPTPEHTAEPLPTPEPVPAAEPVPALAPGPSADGAPLAGELPAPLDSLLARIEQGDRFTAAELGPLYGHVARHGGDVRGHLLLARAFKNLRWSDDIVARYAIALRLDAAATKRDPQILPDLVDLAARDDDPTAHAARLVAASWGAAALPVIEAQLAQTTRPELIGRLRRLRARVAPP